MKSRNIFDEWVLHWSKIPFEAFQEIYRMGYDDAYIDDE